VSGRKRWFYGWNHDRVCVEQSRSKMDINGRYMHALTRLRVGLFVFHPIQVILPFATT